MEIPESGEETPRHERQRLEHVGHGITPVEPPAHIPSHGLPLVVAAVDDRHAFEDVMAGPFSGNDGQTGGVPRQSVQKKAFGTDRPTQKRIVVKIDEVLRQSLDAVHVEFDGAGVEGRQIRGGDVVGMTDDVQFRMGGIEPRGQMPPSDEMYPVHPGREPFHAAKPVTQGIPVAVTLLGSIDRTRCRARITCRLSLRSLKGPVFQKLLPPGRVAAVHPRHHEIYFDSIMPHKSTTTVNHVPPSDRQNL